MIEPRCAVNVAVHTTAKILKEMAKRHHREVIKKILEDRSNWPGIGYTVYRQPNAIHLSFVRNLYNSEGIGNLLLCSQTTLFLDTDGNIGHGVTCVTVEDSVDGHAATHWGHQMLSRAMIEFEGIMDKPQDMVIYYPGSDAYKEVGS